MKIIKILSAIAVAVLFFFGIVFAIAASVQETLTRLAVSVMLLGVGFAIAYYITRKPKTVIHQLEVAEQMKAAALKCPNCKCAAKAVRWNCWIKSTFAVKLDSGSTATHFRAQSVI